MARRTSSGYRHGDTVYDRRTGWLGTVRVFRLSAEDRAAGCAEAEVAWHGLSAADELDVAIANGLRRA